MNRVTGYKCIFETNGERFKFAVTLADAGGEADFAVSNPDAAETLLDMFEDASEAHFNAESGELIFAFDDLDIEEEEGEEEEDETEKEASRDAA